jgi:hypothetical protein
MMVKGKVRAKARLPVSATKQQHIAKYYNIYNSRKLLQKYTENFKI